MRSKFFFLVCAVMLCSLTWQGCHSYKQVPYMQNSDSVSLSAAKGLYDARLMPKDIMSIYVATPENQSVAEMFNLSARPSRAHYGESSVGNSYVTTTRYMVSNEGKINFPVLGEIYVKGMTINELQDYIADRLVGTYLKNRPIVTVELASFKVTVMGEVSKSGVYTVDKGKVNIFEALAMAGDMTIYGQRQNVKVVREDSQGNKSIAVLDLTDANVINSPFYQLQQNDVVYVTPNKSKAKNSDIGSETSLWFSSVSILISLSNLLYNIMK